MTEPLDAKIRALVSQLIDSSPPPPPLPTARGWRPPPRRGPVVGTVLAVAAAVIATMLYLHATRTASPTGLSTEPILPNSGPVTRTGKERLTFRPVIETLVPGATAPQVAAGDAVLAERDQHGHVVREYLVGPVLLDGRIISSATAVRNAGQWFVSFTTTGPGTKQFGDLTTRYVGKQMAIELDGVVTSAPTIQSAITGGNGQITGSFTERQAKDLARVLSGSK